MRWIIMIMVSAVLLAAAPVVEASSPMDKVDVKLAHALMAHKYELAETYFTHGATMPAIREDTPIRRVTGFSSHHKGKRIMIAYFEDEDPKGSRIAFIWEFAIKRNQITYIETIVDAQNPFVNENKVVNEYRKKFDRQVMIPLKYPFNVHTIKGEIAGERLTLKYGDEQNDQYVYVEAEPLSSGSSKLGKDKLVKLKRGYKVEFQQDGMQYTVTLGHTDWLSHVKKQELIQVVELMK